MTVAFRFYAQLNDFLPPHLRGRRLTRVLVDAASVRDTIGAFGVPHPEVDLVVIYWKGSHYRRLREPVEGVRS